MADQLEQDQSMCLAFEPMVTSLNPRPFSRSRERAAKRYSSDLSDREWEIIRPLGCDL